jgi:hypothetical protein
MTRDEVLARLTAERAIFDARVAAVPHDALETPVPGSTHSVKEIVSHVTAYEQLIVERLVAARHGAVTAFERDRTGWEVFNDSTWREAVGKKPKAVLAHSAEVFDARRPHGSDSRAGPEVAGRERAVEDDRDRRVRALPDALPGVGRDREGQPPGSDLVQRVDTERYHSIRRRGP